LRRSPQQYSEDPYAHSRVEASVPGGCDAITFVASKYPPAVGTGYVPYVSKITMVVMAVVLGCSFGRNVVHAKLLRDPWSITCCGKCTLWKGGGLNMFEGFQGSWSCMIGATVACLVGFARLYNNFLLAPEFKPAYTISMMCGLEFVSYARITQSCTWFGDLFTLVMTLDSMLQDQGKSAVGNLFAGWARGSKVAYREKWNGKFRVLCMYLLAGGSTAAMLFSIIGENFNEETEWDFATRGWGTDEAGRVLLGSTITLCDIFILMQDWDFPTFDTNLDVKLPFADFAELKIKMPKW
jgi:hypothetical protein